MTATKGLSHYDNLDLDDADNAAKIKRIYQEWADSYDADNDDALGTVSQPTMVELFAQFVTDKESYLLDAGCGTGLVGSYLLTAGFTNFDGTDISEEMLSHAKGRGYRNLFSANLAQTLPLEDNRYAGCLCVGVFTHGHVGPKGLHELIRITQKGGIIGFTVNEDIYDDYAFDRAISDLEEAGSWAVKLHQKSDYMVKKNVKGIYVISSFTVKPIMPPFCVIRISS